VIIIRPIKKSDFDIFFEFSFESTLGMINLPRDREKLQKKIEVSEESFAKQIKQPEQEEYLFVLEDLTTGRIGGMSGILSRTNLEKYYLYRIETIDTSSIYPISAQKEMQILKLVAGYPNCSEICCLYLQPSFRHSGLGRLLSLSRFLFIAGQRHRFEKRIIAWLRGYVDQKQISPFWQAIGRHFCNLSYVELMSMFEQDRTFVGEILPKYPIYISLLPKEAQEVIGKTHENTKPALTMLQQEGFAFNKEIDVLDGGPILVAQMPNIRTIKNSGLIHIDTVESLPEEGAEFILSNNLLDFRACYGHIMLTSKEKGIINKNVADALGVKKGDVIRYATPH
jgi:arginine N-succinyltransferase